ncbi:MAG: GFA family protein [Pseudorhodoplanes sp.]
MAESYHTGGCHCGQVRYDVTLDLGNVVTCNCSICTKHGFIWSFVPADRFRLKSGADMTSDYQFNKHVIHHLFCKECGTESFARGTAPDGNETVAVNVRCLDKIDIAALKPAMIDGRSR